MNCKSRRTARGLSLALLVVVMGVCQAGSAQNAPVVTSVSPASVAAGGPTFTVTVTGSGFVTNSVVQINGSNRPTTFKSSLQLTATIGDPLSGDARQFTDLYVNPGERYWYRLVAVDKNGNRSDPTRPVAIRVGSPQIPAPPTPTAQYAGSPYPHVVLQFQPPPARPHLDRGATGSNER
jgi:hypothetical protein